MKTIIHSYLPFKELGGTGRKLLCKVEFRRGSVQS